MSMPGFFFFDFRYAPCSMRYASLRLGGSMNSYLVRIYRKADNNPRLLVGVVEEVGVKEKKAFSNLYELWDILNPLKRAPTQHKKNNSKHNQNH
jgi:hypothetical protein